MPREPEPLRGLTKAGSSIDAGSKPASATTQRGTRTWPSHASCSFHLSRHVSSVAWLARTRAVPACSNSARRRAIGSSSLSTVGISTSIARSVQSRSSSSAKAGSSPRGRIARCAAATR